MSKEIEELRRRFFPPGNKGTNLVFQAVVKDIDEELFTCTVTKDKEIDYFDVRLRALINGELNGLACIPKQESTVLVCRIGGSNELFVCLFSEIDKIVYSAGKDKKISFIVDPDKMELKWGEKVCASINEQTIKLTNDATTLEMLKDKIKLNGGEDGLVMIEELTKKLNELVSAFNNHVHDGVIVDVTGQAEGTSGSSKKPTSNASDFTRDAYENTKILQ